MLMQHSKQAVPRAMVSLRAFSTQPTATGFEAAVHERGGGALSQAQYFVPRTANLSSTRSVLRLAGPRPFDISAGAAQPKLVMYNLLEFACRHARELMTGAPAKLLQGLVTNDVAPLEDQHARPMYACILNAQGRFLHDLFLHRQPGMCVLLFRHSVALSAANVAECS